MKKGFFKKGLVLGIILLFVGAGVLPSTGVRVKEKSIDPILDGNILYVGGSGPDNYTSIQDAINDSVDGDTVFVYDDSSPYYVDETNGLEIDKSINLIGENKETTVIDGNKANITVVRVGAYLVTISGFTIQNNGYFFPKFNAGIILNGDFATINDNIITLNTHGIKLNGDYATINDNIITSNQGEGIEIYYGGMSESWCSLITGNTIINNSGGIGVAGFYHVISDNNIIENDCGIGVMGSYIGDYNIITGNNISSNNNYGINVYYGINNIFHHNNFRNNGENAYDYGNNIWDDGEYGNYWDNYTGIDGDGNGIGDTPYFIPGGDNKDRYPMMDPWPCGQWNNSPPHKPDIVGPITGKPGVEYTFSINASDPDGDNLYVRWGEEYDLNPWEGPIESGTEINYTRKWSASGKFIVRVTIVDYYGGFATDTLEISIPRNKAIIYNLNLWSMLFEDFPFLKILLNNLRRILL